VGYIPPANITNWDEPIIIIDDDEEENYPPIVISDSEDVNNQFFPNDGDRINILTDAAAAVATATFDQHQDFYTGT